MNKRCETFRELVSTAEARPSLSSKTPYVHQAQMPDNSSLSQIEKLPIEILLDIVDYSPCEASIALSLTSKYFHDLLFCKTIRACDAHVKLKLLRLLEHDLPRYVACATCVRLYDWKASALYGYSHSCPARGNPNAAKHTKGRNIGPRFRGHFLTVEQRDLILRAARFGPDYGLPLSFLENGFTSIDWPGNKCHSSCVPRISERSLVVWRTVTFVVSPEAERPRYPYGLMDSACDHAASYLWPIYKCAVSHLDLKQPPTSQQTRSTRQRPKCLQLLTCALCATDIQLEFYWNAAGEVALRVHTWMDFGDTDTDLFDPFDPQDEYFFANHDGGRQRFISNAALYFRTSFIPDIQPVQQNVPQLLEQDGRFACLEDGPFFHDYPVLAMHNV